MKKWFENRTEVIFGFGEEETTMSKSFFGDNRYFERLYKVKEEKVRYQFLIMPDIYFYKSKGKAVFSTKFRAFSLDYYIYSLFEYQGMSNKINNNNKASIISTLQQVIQVLEEDSVSMSELLKVVNQPYQKENMIISTEMEDIMCNLETGEGIIKELEELFYADKEKWEFLLLILYFKPVVIEHILFLTWWIEINEEEISLEYK